MKRFFQCALVATAVEAGLKVMSPKELSMLIDGTGAGVIPSSLGNFGHIDYGASTLGQVLTPVGNEYGCQSFTLDHFPHLSLDMPINFFVLVKRGKCNNPTKVRNVEAIGGSVALIADSTEESLAELVMEDSSGSQTSLTIPGYMIDHDAAVQITS